MMKRQGNQRAATRLFLLLATGVIAAEELRAAPFTVTNASDSGAGSQRQAIVAAIANPDADTITFDDSLGGATSSKVADSRRSGARL